MCECVTCSTKDFRNRSIRAFFRERQRPHRDRRTFEVGTVPRNIAGSIRAFFRERPRQNGERPCAFFREKRPSDSRERLLLMPAIVIDKRMYSFQVFPWMHYSQNGRHGCNVTNPIQIHPRADLYGNRPRCGLTQPGVNFVKRAW